MRKAEQMAARSGEKNATPNTKTRPERCYPAAPKKISMKEVLGTGTGENTEQEPVGRALPRDWAPAREQTENQSRHRKSVVHDFCYDEKRSANSRLGEHGAKWGPDSLITSKTGNNSRSQCHNMRYGAGKQKTNSGAQIEVETCESFHR
jgi:hypothetical protein